jgi:hypothetical protein
MNGIRAFIKENSFSFYHVRIQGEVAICDPRSGLSLDSKSANAFIQHSEQYISIVYQPPSDGILLQQAKWIKTRSIGQFGE